MNLSVLAIEMITAVLGLLVLVLGLITPVEQRRGVGYFAALGLATTALVTMFMFNVQGTAFADMYITDSFSNFFKITFLVGGVMVAMFSFEYVKKLGHSYGEYFGLVIFAILGMMVMVSAGDLITLYMGLELMTITFIILAAYAKGDKKSSEAGLKYILLSAMSSGVLLYGMSIVFGAAGSTVYAEIVANISAGGIQPLTMMGLIFLLVGFGFKISMVPFHMWSPDVYEGAPTPVTAFLAAGSKAAAMGAFMRMFMIALPQTKDTWIVLLIMLAGLTMVLGNLVAIPQTNIKRMLAYSGVAHAGYLLLGVIAFTSLGVSGILYYIALYVFANIGAFAVVATVSNATGSDEIKDYAGMWKRSPLLSAAMLVSLLSLAGIPPLAGFIGKFYLFTAIIEQGYLWLAFLAIGMSMVSVYYYLIVAKVMFIGNPVDETPIPVSVSVQTVLYVTMVVSLFLGIYPGPLTDLATKVAQAFFTM